MSELNSRTALIKEQTRAVAKTGKSNMLDSRAVLGIALEMDFYELADFIYRVTKQYAQFIITGQLDDVPEYL